MPSAFTAAADASLQRQGWPQVCGRQAAGGSSGGGGRRALPCSLPHTACHEDAETHARTSSRPAKAAAAHHARAWRRLQACAGPAAGMRAPGTPSRRLPNGVLLRRASTEGALALGGSAAGLGRGAPVFRPTTRCHQSPGRPIGSHRAPGHARWKASEWKQAPAAPAMEFNHRPPERSSIASSPWPLPVPQLDRRSPTGLCGVVQQVRWGCLISCSVIEYPGSADGRCSAVVWKSSSCNSLPAALCGSVRACGRLAGTSAVLSTKDGLQAPRFSRPPPPPLPLQASRTSPLPLQHPTPASRSHERRGAQAALLPRVQRSAVPQGGQGAQGARLLLPQVRGRVFSCCHRGLLGRTGRGRHPSWWLLCTGQRTCRRSCVPIQLPLCCCAQGSSKPSQPSCLPPRLPLPLLPPSSACSCPYQEDADPSDWCVYRNEVHHTSREKSVVLQVRAHPPAALKLLLESTSDRAAY